MKLPARDRRAAASEQVRAIGRAFGRGLKIVLGTKLHGAYVYGAAVASGGLPARDIDFHVILNGPLTRCERSALEGLHESLARRYPTLGGELDGYYILLEDARSSRPPRSQMWQRAFDRSWALHREHLRAGRCLVLHGPNPVEVCPPATWSELERALQGELGYVEEHLQEYPDYCILNLCRLVYSFETRTVAVSKAEASDWACAALPEWRRPVKAAQRSYAGQSTPRERRLMLREVAGLFESARARIRAARRRNRRRAR